MFYCCDFFLYLFILFRQPNLGRPWTDLPEIWHADRKLMQFMNAGPKWGLMPPKRGAKIWQISNGAYSSELITLEWKRISACWKRLWNQKKTFYHDLWPLYVNTVNRFYMYKYENFSFFCDSFKTFCCNPPSNFHCEMLMYFKPDVFYKLTWKICALQPINANEWKYS